MDANFAKQAVVAAVPRAGKVKEMCPQCLLMQRLSSPCHCIAVQPGKAALLLRLMAMPVQNSSISNSIFNQIFSKILDSQ
jgi:hypothetical protein